MQQIKRSKDEQGIEPEKKTTLFVMDCSSSVIRGKNTPPHYVMISDNIDGIKTILLNELQMVFILIITGTLFMI